MGKVIVVNDRGQQKVIAEQAWALMRNSKEQGNTRKGWTLVGPLVPGKGPVAPVRREAQPSFIPPEVEEAVNAAAAQEKQREAEMIGGESASPAVAEANEASATEPATTTEAADDLAGMETVGAKAAGVLNSMGIHTFAQLAKAPIGKVNKALDDANLSPKKAQVPKWIAAAKDAAKK